MFGRERDEQRGLGDQEGTGRERESRCMRVRRKEEEISISALDCRRSQCSSSNKLQATSNDGKKCTRITWIRFPDPRVPVCARTCYCVCMTLQTESAAVK